jgi:DNA-binding response OmpR family regulator
MSVNLADLSGARVLVAEDNPSLRELLELCLRQAGAAVHAASTLEDGLAALHDVGPDIVVFNVMLDDAGLPLAATAQQLGIPAIAVTERVTDMAVDVLLRAHGATLVSAFDYVAVVSTVSEVLKAA